MMEDVLEVHHRDGDQRRSRRENLVLLHCLPSVTNSLLC